MSVNVKTASAPSPAPSPASSARQDTPSNGSFHMDASGDCLSWKMVPVLCYGMKKDGVTPYEFNTMMRVISESETSLEVVDPRDVKTISKVED